MIDFPLCGYCMLPVAKGLPGIKHMGTSVAHPHVSMCLEATREAARAWQALRDWLNGVDDGEMVAWNICACNEYERGLADGYTEGLKGG